MKFRNAEVIEQKAIVDNDNLFIMNNPKFTNVFSVYLTSDIGDSKAYRDLYNLLRESNPDDYFILYMSNHGGYLYTGLEIINAIRASSGHVLCCLTGGNYSMAPLIALAAEKIFVEEDAFMMFHDYSGGTEGKGNEQAAQIAHVKPHFDTMFRKVTRGFLKKGEATKILNGQDLYLKEDEVIARLKKIKKLGNGEIPK